MMVDECDVYSLALIFDVYFQNLSSTTRVHDIKIHVTRGMIRKIMLFIGKKPKGRSMMISNATTPLKESRKKISIEVCGLYIHLCVVGGQALSANHRETGWGPHEGR